MLTDTEIANRYINKQKNAQERGVEFTLPLLSFINVMRAKRCHYTGLELNERTVTIDRVDNSKGYIKGNVVACCKLFNSFKGWIENPENPVTLEDMKRGIKRWRS